MPLFSPLEAGEFEWRGSAIFQRIDVWQKELTPHPLTTLTYGEVPTPILINDRLKHYPATRPYPWWGRSDTSLISSPSQRRWPTRSPQSANLTMVTIVIIFSPDRPALSATLMNKGVMWVCLRVQWASAPRLQQTQNRILCEVCWRGQASTGPRWANQALPMLSTQILARKRVWRRACICMHLMYAATRFGKGVTQKQ